MHSRRVVSVSLQKRAAEMLIYFWDLDLGCLHILEVNIILLLSKQKLDMWTLAT
jgi:hypothetical protein